MKRVNRGLLIACAVLAASRVGLLAAPAGATYALNSAVEVREGDTWSPATFERAEGRRSLIKYSDGTEEWVSADRIRMPGSGGPGSVTPPDANPANPGTTAGPANGGDAPAPAGAGGERVVAIDDRPITIGLRQLEGPTLRANVQIRPKPTTKPSAPYTDLTPATANDLGHVEQTFICADKPSIAVAVGARRNDDTPLWILDTEHPDASVSRIFHAHEHQILSAADGGRLLLTRPTTWEGKTLHLWAWIDGSYQPIGNYAFVNAANAFAQREGDARKADSGILLSPTRMLVRSNFGNTFLIDLRTHRQLGYIDCGDLKLHPSGLYFVTTKDNAPVLLRPSDLAVIGQPPGATGKDCIDATGTFAAVANDHAVRVLNLSTGKELAHIAGLPDGRLDLLGQTELLIDGKYYYDLKTGIPAWTYNTAPGTASLLLGNGQMLYVTSNGNDSRACMTSVPDDAPAAALAHPSPDRFDLAPGAHIAIEGDLAATGDAKAARDNLTKVITAAGHVVDDNAGVYVLSVETAPGKTGKAVFKDWSVLPPADREVDTPTTIITLTLQRRGVTIWTRKVGFSAQLMIQVKRGQSIQDAANEAGKPNPGRLASLDLPSYIVKQPNGADADNAGNQPPSTLGSSTLTPTGFTPDATP